MNREIKFRAWVGDKMEYQVLVGQLGAFFAYQDPKDTHCAINTKYGDTIPVMQYTGLKDKNGKEIYEQDICKWLNHLNQKMKGEAGLAFAYDGMERRNLEVIGNIYENSELLK